MSTGNLAVQLHAQSWSGDTGIMAIAEISSVTRLANLPKPKKLALAVNAPPETTSLPAGQYVVRLYLPSGEVQAELVDVSEGRTEVLGFDIGRSPREWLGPAATVGIVQTLPRVRDTISMKDAISRSVQVSLAGSGQAFGVGTSSLVVNGSDARLEVATKALSSLEHSASEVNRISGRDLVVNSQGWYSTSRIAPTRTIPEDRLSQEALVRWWTGTPISDPMPMAVVQSDSRNARLSIEHPAPLNRIGLDEGSRAFAKVKDPVGGWYFAVFPEGWANSSWRRFGQLSTPSILLTVIVDTAMTTSDSLVRPARWRCAPELDDLETMSLLGFLYSGQTEAAQMMVERAHGLLFEKTINPVAAAIGAYTLLSHSAEANQNHSPDWRRWIRNLYKYFPSVPDGAIAMAQMTMSFGESDKSDEVDVERLRGYALEAVRRGLPYLGMGVRRLTDVLVAIEGDDRAVGRRGPNVDETRMALTMVRELGRITVPGEFFTVLQLNEENS